MAAIPSFSDVHLQRICDGLADTTTGLTGSEIGGLLHDLDDVLSMRANSDRRCIEVKGRAGTGEIEVTDNEWARACNLRSDYWLYAVYHCATATPQMVRVKDPFEKLLVRPFTKTQVEETVREVGGVRIAHSQVVEVGEI